MDNKQGRGILDRRRGDCCGLAFPNLAPGGDSIRQLTIRLDHPTDDAKYLIPRGAPTWLLPARPRSCRAADASLPSWSPRASRRCSLRAPGESLPRARSSARWPSGVWNWRGKRIYGGAARLRSMTRPNRHGRVALSTSSSTATAQKITMSKTRARPLRPNYSRRGAEVRLVDLPAISAGVKSRRR